MGQGVEDRWVDLRPHLRQVLGLYVVPGDLGRAVGDVEAQLRAWVDAIAGQVTVEQARELTALDRELRQGKAELEEKRGMLDAAVRAEVAEELDELRRLAALGQGLLGAVEALGYAWAAGQWRAAAEAESAMGRAAG
ncbi:MAG: hypothetical protein JW940_27315 [Polyangiaceae bacterium]|nr:hypothetical protein [Polyangiaceae bacterium]